MRDLPPLNPLLAFEVAARHLSFTKAAQELNVTQGAISRQVAVLEEYFGAPLFTRQHNGLALTRSAEIYAAELRGAFSEIRAATKAYMTGGGRSVLTVVGYTLFLNRWLVPKLPAFSERHPKIDVRIIGTSAATAVNFTSDNADVGIRYGGGRWRGIESHLLFRDALVPVCTPQLMSKLKLRSARDLAGKKLLQAHSRARDWPEWFAAGGVNQSDALSRITSFEDSAVVWRCVLDGDGIALLQEDYVQAMIKIGRLVIPCGPVLKRNLGYHLIYPTVRASVPKISVFRDWLLDH